VAGEVSSSCGAGDFGFSDLTAVDYTALALSGPWQWKISMRGHRGGKRMLLASYERQTYRTLGLGLEYSALTIIPAS
jgi:hypothetical protein